MAKELKCADIGFACDAVIEADTEDEVMAQAAEHARTVHAMSDEDLKQHDAAIRGAIRDV